MALSLQGGIATLKIHFAIGALALGPLVYLTLTNDNLIKGGTT